MGRPRIRDGLDQFCDWMRETGRCSPTTAKEYTSHVRRAVRALNGNIEDAEAVNRFFAEAYESDHSYGKMRSGWTVFAEWAADSKGVNIPIPEPVSLVRAKAKARTDRAKTKRSLPPDVRAALRTLRQDGIPVSHIAKLRWTDVDLTEMTQRHRTHVRVPGKREEWLVASESIKVLWDWAAVGTDLSKPLVPRDPGNHQPYSYSGLREEIEIYTEKELEERMGGPAGSALGGAPPRGFLSIPEDVEPDEDDLTPELGGNSPESLSDALGYDPNAVD
jgi:integrase